MTWIKPEPPLVSKLPVGQSSGLQYLAQLRDEPTVNTAFEYTAQSPLRLSLLRPHSLCPLILLAGEPFSESTTFIV